jgi:hypothetical protein
MYPCVKRMDKAVSVDHTVVPLEFYVTRRDGWEVLADTIFVNHLFCVIMLVFVFYCGSLTQYGFLR